MPMNDQRRLSTRPMPMYETAARFCQHQAGHVRPTVDDPVTRHVQMCAWCVQSRCHRQARHFDFRFDHLGPVITVPRLGPVPSPPYWCRLTSLGVCSSLSMLYQLAGMFRLKPPPVKRFSVERASCTRSSVGCARSARRCSWRACSRLRCSKNFLLTSTNSLFTVHRESKIEKLKSVVRVQVSSNQTALLREISYLYSLA